MKLHLNHITADSPEDLSSWTPPDKYDVLEFIRIGIGSSRKTADDFFLKVATPKGLARSSPLNGVLASRPLVVFEYFDYDLLRNWIEEILKSCEDEDWPKSVEKLRRHFNWEYDNYKVY